MNRFFIVVVLLGFGCNQPTETNNAKGKENAQVEFSIEKSNHPEPFSSKIQRDTSKMHQYDDILLFKTDVGTYSSIDINGSNYLERYPGILNKKDIRKGKVTELIIYNSGDVYNRVNLDTLNPYVQKFKNIRFAYPSFEQYITPSIEQIKTLQTQIPDDYLTFYDFGETNLNGFTPIAYFLAPIKDGYKLPWNSSTIVLDSTGKKIYNFEHNSDLIPACLSDDGSLFGYSENSNPDNPGNINNEPRFKIVNTQDTSVVLNLQGIGYASDSEYGYIMRSSGFSEVPPYKGFYEFININSRIMYSMEFTQSEFGKAWSNYPSWLEMLNNLPFNEKSF